MRPKNLTKIRWSKKLAYVVGLIATDGNLSKDGRHIDFTSNDIELINILKKILKINNKIGKKPSGSCSKSYSRIQIGSVTFYNWLIKIGLTVNKSCTIGELKIPDKYFFDFLRGNLDGDGSIRVYNDSVFKNSVRLYTRFASASPIYLAWINRKVYDLSGIKGNLSNGHGKTKELSYGKTKSRILLKYLYYKDNLPCLTRKKEIAKQFI